MADHLELVGKLLTGDPGRDAIHIAIAPAVAATALDPGDWVGFVSEGDFMTVSTTATRKLGIVDPFLRHAVKPGEKFFVFLKPQTTTGLRHVWSHPAYPEEE